MFGINTSFVGSEETARLSYEVAKARVGQAVVDEAAQFRKENRITVWILLRSIHRSWINQVDGIAHYINALQEKYGPCSFVFDGHTVLDEGQNHTPDEADVVEQNRQSIAEEQASLEEILKIVSVSDYKNLIGSSVYEKIVWAHIPTFTMQPLGSGFTWTGWISNRPAVLHIPPWANAFFRAQAYTPERSQPRVFVDNAYYTLQNDPPSKEDGYFLDWRGVMAASDRLLAHLGYMPKAGG